jgi:AraC family transcriptional regulator
MTHQLFEYGTRKFSNAGLILSSEGRRWGNVGAELRRHESGPIVPVPPTQMEVTLAIRGSAKSNVFRRAGRTQKTLAQTGTIWFCPIGVQEEEIFISETIPEVLHLYIPIEQFANLAERDGLNAARPSEIHYKAGVDDALVRELCQRIYCELCQETAAGSMLVESLGHALAMHINFTHSPLAKERPFVSEKGALDSRRLNRVIDFIRANLEVDLSVADLTEVACLSRHHFTRSFQKSTGLAPHHYVAKLRLDSAKKMLVETEIPVVDIALNCQFSSQSAFGRAFLKMTGVSPAEYRRIHRR